MPRIQAYVDDEMYEILKKIASETQASISQVAGNAIVSGLKKSPITDTVFEAKKTNALLSYVLGAVYDRSIIDINSEKVSQLIDNIEAAIKQKMTID
jgi:hypothetical protein